MGVISGYIHKVPEHKSKAVWKEMLAAPAGLFLFMLLRSFRAAYRPFHNTSVRTCACACVVDAGLGHRVYSHDHSSGWRSVKHGAVL